MESRGVQELRHARTHCTGTWEVFMPFRCRGGIAEERETVTEDVRHEEVRLGHSSREVGEQRGVSPGGADGAKGRAQGESGKPKHTPGSGLGKCVTRGGPDTAICTTGATGASDGASPPCHGRYAALGVLRFEEERSGGCGRHDVAEVRGRVGRPTGRPARPRALGSVPGAAIATGEYPEAGWRHTTARRCGHRGQDRPEGGDGDYPDADLRGGVPGVQLRVPARAWGAQRARCARGRVKAAQDQLGGGL